MTDQPDPFKADAAIVYRVLRDSGPGSAADLAERCFPVTVDGPESTIAALRKRSYRRVFDSIVWMRHQGVVLSAVPTSSWPGSTIFALGALSFDLSKVARPVALTVEPARTLIRARQVAQKLASSDDGPSGDLMGVWHGE